MPVAYRQRLYLVGLLFVGKNSIFPPVKHGWQFQTLLRLSFYSPARRIGVRCSTASWQGLACQRNDEIEEGANLRRLEWCGVMVRVQGIRFLGPLRAHLNEPSLCQAFTRVELEELRDSLSPETRREERGDCGHHQLSSHVHAHDRVAAHELQTTL